ncbi:hypothetical protein [Amycolatopsis sp. Hca4]|uniref:hypothetical protein n=1 Tax=Amycolatopsis sp. Hca4 TaxID=2742131 RepID=UPI001591CDC2|nr:hypothetical protein [Amycolatopsis sp. Hca4]QKV73419.1 hypothetical protein HUT10_06200 [Amycolatopsis sp. Hca4]
MTAELAGLLATWLAGQTRQRLEMSDLVRAATKSCPSLVGDPAGRTKIADAIRKLTDDGLIVVPKAAAGWDNRARPPLPHWVRKPPGATKPAAVGPERVWPEALAAAAAVAQRPDEFDFLDRLANWLKENPRPERVPIEERSLELLDDEKALSALQPHRLFTSGAVTLELLACFPPPLLFPSQYVPGVGPARLLIAENNATFHSLLTVARSLDPVTRPALHLGWGIGNQIPVGIAAVELLQPRPRELFYFGDLDVAGLRAASGAAATAARLGLPPVRPAEPLYRWLLDHGTARPDKSNRGSVDVPALTAWLSEDIREAAARLIREGARIPQETVGLKELRANPGLLEAAVGFAGPALS